VVIEYIFEYLSLETVLPMLQSNLALGLVSRLVIKIS
jgi:hypothetical protein